MTTLGSDVIVDFDVPGTQIEAAQAYRDQLVAAGFTVVSERSVMSSTGMQGLSLRVEMDDFSMQVTSGADRFEPDQATIGCSYSTDPT